MRRPLLALSLLALAALAPASAHAASPFEIEEASVSLSTTQAGAHADFTTHIRLAEPTEGDPYVPVRDVVVELPPGIAGNPEAFPACTSLQLGTAPEQSECPLDAQVGSTDVELSEGFFKGEPIYNMTVPDGDAVARFGFFAGPFPVILKVRLDPETNQLVAAAEGITSTEFIGATTTFWGVPASPVHDLERLTPEEASFFLEGPPGGRSSTLPEVPFMTNPTGCESGRKVRITARSYADPGSPIGEVVPFPRISGCGAVEFDPSVAIAPSTGQGSSATGLDFELELPNKGLEFGNLLSTSQLKRTEVTLPEGMTVNPSAAEGLGVCSESAYDRERYDSGPNVGCPESSKLGRVVAESPVVDRDAVGSLYLAKPYDNPFGSLLALYMVLKIPDRGVLVKLAGRVEPDPRSGRLVTTFDDVPQLPVSRVSLSFREGDRAPLITPPECGAHETVAQLNPWSDPSSSARRTSAFGIGSGPDRGPCPPGGALPFDPGFGAGTLNNAAGAYSPFLLRLTREDGEQDLTKFSAVLPPGVAGRIAGIPWCPDAAIAGAASRDGRDEQRSPSCPAASRLGRVLAGAGVGSVLTYAGGSLHLAGPYKGAPLSVAAIVPAVAGPFDVGTVVTRVGLRLNRITGQVEVDGAASDPIPHILAGIPLKVRDIRVVNDRPGFTLNPTSCEPSNTFATIWGGGSNLFSAADDAPFGAASRFQAASCASLRFAPRLAIKLRGGVRRGAHPALRAVVTPRPGEANFSRAVVTLPRSAFLEQGHIRTICTRVQFAAGAGNGAACPPGSVYGRARAWSPLLDAPAEGPVFLRSSNNNLPDLVVALKGPASAPVDVELSARIDSVKGGIRSTFTGIPDLPVSRFILDMQGGKKGLIVNSRHLCFKPKRNRAKANLRGQNGRFSRTNPRVIATTCAKRRKAKRNRARRSAGHVARAGAPR